MKAGMVVVVILGLLAALAAALLVQGLTQSGRQVSTAPSDAEVQVLVAAKALPAMTVLDSSAVEVKRVPVSARPAGALSDPVQVVGRVLIVPMVAGEAFGEEKFANKGTGVHLASALASGKRAVSVLLTDHTGMVGLLYPGAVVDVMVSIQQDSAGGRRGEMITRTLLQGVQVLATGRQSVVSDDAIPDKSVTGRSSSSGDQRMVTLLLDPKEAQELYLGAQLGTISLVMRNPMDRDEVKVEPTRLADVTGRSLQMDLPDESRPSLLASMLVGLSQMSRQAKPVTAPEHQTQSAAQAPAPAMWETTIIRGMTSEVRTFPMPNVEPKREPTAGVSRAPTAGAMD